MAEERKFSNSAYLQNPSCPSCGSSNITPGSDKNPRYIKDPNGPQLFHTKSAKCKDCGYTWKEIYKCLGVANEEDKTLVLNTTLALFRENNSRLSGEENSDKTNELTKTTYGALCCANCGEKTLVPCIPQGLGEYSMSEFRKDDELIYVLLCKRCGHAFAVVATPERLVVKHPKVSPAGYYGTGYGSGSGYGTGYPAYQKPFTQGCGSDLKDKVEGKLGKDLGSSIDSLKTRLNTDDEGSSISGFQMPRECIVGRRNCNTCTMPDKATILPTGCLYDGYVDDDPVPPLTKDQDDFDDMYDDRGLRRVK